MALEPERVSLRHAAELVGLHRLNGLRTVEPDILVELLWQDRVEVVAGALGLGPIDHANRPLESRLSQFTAQHGARGLAQRQQECARAGLVAQALVAVRV